MWTDYSTREAAEFVGLSESVVRSCVRAGVVAPVVSGVAMRFAFRDLLVLKMVRELTRRGVSLRRVRRQLTALRGRLSDDASLAALHVAAQDGHVVVRECERAWRADTGQLVFGFAAADPGGPVGGCPRPAGQVSPLPLRVAAGADDESQLAADDWFERALQLEEDNPAAAMAAYHRVLELRPDCVETLINLGRLYAEASDIEHAACCFRRALDLEPCDATALYNLGVVAQDAGRDAEAVELYRRALQFDPALAEAHYNLATIFDRGGDPRAAIRHINEYRKLTRGPGAR